jgi:hypothetical protein
LGAISTGQPIYQSLSQHATLSSKPEPTPTKPKAVPSLFGIEMSDDISNSFVYLSYPPSQSPSVEYKKPYIAPTYPPTSYPIFPTSIPSSIPTTYSSVDLSNNPNVKPNPSPSMVLSTVLSFSTQAIHFTQQV